MATDTNVVMLCGRLTGSLSVKHTNTGYAIGSFTIAVNRTRKDAQGNYIDKASFIDCALFGAMADNLSKYLIKGKQVVITGYIDQDRWEKDGQKYTKLKLVVQTLQMTGKKDNAGTKGGVSEDDNNAEQNVTWQAESSIDSEQIPFNY